MRKDLRIAAFLLALSSSVQAVDLISALGLIDEKPYDPASDVVILDDLSDHGDHARLMKRFVEAGAHRAEIRIRDAGSNLAESLRVLRDLQEGKIDKTVVLIGYGHEGFSEEEAAIVRDLLTHGAVIVAPAGNSPAAVRIYPAAYPGVVSVGPTENGLPADFRTRVDSTRIFVPGVDLDVPPLGKASRMTSETVTGSSYSASGVAAMAARLLGVGRTPRQIWENLVSLRAPSGPTFPTLATASTNVVGTIAADFSPLKGSRSLHYLRLSDAGKSDLQNFRAQVKTTGLRLKHDFRASGVIAEGPGSGVQALIDQGLVRTDSTGLDQSEAVIKQLWETRFEQAFQLQASNRFVDLGNTDPNALQPADAANAIFRQGLFTPSPPFGVTPGFSTSEFLAGRIAVTVLFSESNGNLEPNLYDWTIAEQTQILGNIVIGYNWLDAAVPGASLEFVYDVRFNQDSDYEGISHFNIDQWISDMYTKIGFPGTNGYTQGFAVNTSQRLAMDADWAVVNIIAGNDDSNPCFPTGGCTAFANLGGPHTVSTQIFAEFPMVFAHETLHCFRARDSYAGHSCSQTSGYFQIRNGNAEMDGLAAWCGGINDPLSVMRGNFDMSTLTFDMFARGQVGLADEVSLGFDADGILGALDTHPQTTCAPAGPATVPFGSTVTIQGTSQDIPLVNQACPTCGNITINAIENVQYRLNGGTWTNAVITDGAGDESIEDYSFTIGPLTGNVTVEVRGVNSQGNSDLTTCSVSVQVTGSGPCTGCEQLCELWGVPNSSISQWTGISTSPVLGVLGPGEGSIDLPLPSGGWGSALLSGHMSSDVELEVVVPTYQTGHLLTNLTGGMASGLNCASCYQFAINPGTYDMAIRRMSGASSTMVGGGPITLPLPAGISFGGPTFVMRVKKTGSLLELFVNGTLVMSRTDASPLGIGQVALQAFNPSPGTRRYGKVLLNSNYCNNPEGMTVAGSQDVLLNGLNDCATGDPPPSNVPVYRWLDAGNYVIYPVPGSMWKYADPVPGTDVYMSNEFHWGRAEGGAISCPEPLVPMGEMGGYSSTGGGGLTYGPKNFFYLPARTLMYFNVGDLACSDNGWNFAIRIDTVVGTPTPSPTITPTPPTVLSTFDLLLNGLTSCGMTDPPPPGPTVVGFTGFFNPIYAVPVYRWMDAGTYRIYPVPGSAWKYGVPFTNTHLSNAFRWGLASGTSAASPGTLTPMGGQGMFAPDAVLYYDCYHEFTLSAPTLMYFYVNDSACSDNGWDFAIRLDRLSPPPTPTPTPTPTPPPICSADYISDASDGQHKVFYEVVYQPQVGPANDGSGKSWSEFGYDDSTWGGVICIGIPQGGVAALPESPMPPLLTPRPTWCAAGTASQTTADWIAPTLPPDTGCPVGYPTFLNGDVYYLRRNFTLPGVALSFLQVQVAADNVAEVYVDGQLLSGVVATYNSGQAIEFDLLPYITLGLDHTIGFKVYNQDNCSQTGLVYAIRAEICGATPFFAPPLGGGAAAAVGSHRVPGKQGTPGFVMPDGKSVISVPNPSAGKVEVIFDLSQASRARIVVSDLTGAQVLREDFGDLPKGLQRRNLDLSGNANGVYVAALLVDKGMGYGLTGTFKIYLLAR